MPTNKKPIPRTSIPAVLIQQFLHDYELALKQYKPEQRMEITEHLLKVLDVIEVEDYNTYQSLEEALVKRYGKAIKYYRNAAFHKYFQFDMVLVEKDIYSPEVFNKLLGHEQTLSEQEAKRFIFGCRKGLRNALYQLYADREPEFESEEESEVKTISRGNPEADKEITRSRQLLAIYYLLKSSFHIEHRQSNFISESARFAHLLTGVKFMSLQTSDIYKKFQKLPNHKNSVALLEDLKYIRPFFEGLDLEKALQMIDTEIGLIKKELPYQSRKKYSEG